jgi:putative endonuclease
MEKAGSRRRQGITAGDGTEQMGILSRRKARNREIGDLGEDAAEAFLSNEGYRILERNHRCAAGELDIIAEDCGRIAFVEVKTRSPGTLHAPEEAVDSDKRRRLRRAAKFYLSRFREPSPARFDIVSVMLTVDGKVESVELRKNAFDWQE